MFSKFNDSRQHAERVVLAWCRSKPRGLGTLVMRDRIAPDSLYAPDRVVVMNIDRTEPVPGVPNAYRSELVAGGQSWDEVLASLVQRGLVTL